MDITKKQNIKSFLFIAAAGILSLLPELVHGTVGYLSLMVLLLILSRVYYGRDFITKTGIALDTRSALITFLLLLTTVGISLVFIRMQIFHISLKSGILESWPLLIPGILVQAFCEELTFRGIILGRLKDIFRAKAALILLVAVIFSLSHFLLYRASENTSLSGTTLCTLFVFGVITNYLFFRSGKIWYAWALHAGWNISRFSSLFIDASTGKAFSEGAGFNALEGQNSTFLLSIAVFILVRVLMGPVLQTEKSHENC